MKVVVLGGTGHIGTYLIPLLAKEGYEVICITRGKSRPYRNDTAWSEVQFVELNRDITPDFEHKIAQLSADVVIDLISFHVEDTKRIVEALEATQISQYVFCSSIWAHGRAEEMPEDPNWENKDPLEDYGDSPSQKRYGWNKYQSELYLKQKYKESGFPSTVIMPGQICGPEWMIITPYGNGCPDVFQKIADGKKIYLPNFGMETLHHVHVKDVARMFVCAIGNRDQALGESFHAVSGGAITLYGYAKLVYQIFGRKPDISFLSWDKWCEYINDPAAAEETYFHIARSGFYSIQNAVEKIGYQPEYSTRETIRLCISEYVKQGIIK